MTPEAQAWQQVKEVRLLVQAVRTDTLRLLRELLLALWERI